MEELWAMFALLQSNIIYMAEADCPNGRPTFNTNDNSAITHYKVWTENAQRNTKYVNINDI